MTWDTNLGQRVLEDVEAEVYLTAMQDAIEHLQDTRDLDEPEVLTGDRIFDIASFGQKVVLLHHCLSVLLKPRYRSAKVNERSRSGCLLPICVSEYAA